MAVSHVKSSTIGDFTGTVTVHNSTGGTQTVAATNLVRPSDWNSAHNQIYTLSGNTVGNSTVSGTNVVFQGGGNVYLSGTGSTIIFGGSTVSGWNPYQDLPMVAGQLGQGTLQFDPEMVRQQIVFDRVAYPLTFSNASNSSGSATVSLWVGFYTQNASTLSLLHSASMSTALTMSGTVGSYSLYSGVRVATFGYSQTVTPGEYWIGAVSRTTTGGANMSVGNVLGSNVNSVFAGQFGAAHTTTMQWTLGQGVYSATTSGMPASVAFSQIRGSDSVAFRALAVKFPYSTV